MKKLLTILMLLAASLPLWAETFLVDGIKYEIEYSRKVAVISGGSYSGDIVIPSSVKYKSFTYIVTSIGYNAFSGCTGLTSITIPSSVTSIGKYAFDNCTSLKEVKIDDSPETLSLGYNGSGEGLFYDCPLESLYFGRNLSYEEGYSPFSNIKTLKEITIGYCVSSIGNCVTSIGNSAFEGCTGLTSITIPDGVTSIGIGAFSGCTGLTSINLPKSVTSIGSGAFSGCTGLTEFTIPDGVTSIACFSGCTGLTSITIPNSVTSIGNYAFSRCTGLTSINLPNSVTSIGESAFYNCTGLASITIPNSVTSIGIGAFESCSGLTEITIPNSVTSIGNVAFKGCTGLTSVTIGNGVTSIGINVFEGCSGLTEITIPNSVTSIGEYAFSSCTGLTEVVIGNSVTSIGNYAFEGCSGLTEITIPNSVTSIGYFAFSYCTSLRKIDISENIQSFGDYYLYGNQQDLTIIMRSLNPPMHVDPYVGFDKSGWTLRIPYEEVLPLYKEKGWIGDYKLSYFNFEFDGICYEAISNSKVRVISNVNKYSGSVVIPSSVEYDGTIYSVTSIGNYAFDNCTSLKEVKIEDGNATLSLGYNGDSEGLFYDCPLESFYLGRNISYEEGRSPFGNNKTLKEITIGNCVTSIGNYAFDNCTSLKEVKIEDGNATLSLGYNGVGEVLFYDCPLETLYLGRNLSYENAPFSQIKTLKEITIGNSVTSIGEYAFSDCTGLTSITIPNSITSIGNSVFDNCISLKEVKMEDGEETLSLGYNVYNRWGIGEGLFYDCPLESLYLGRNISYDERKEHGYSPFCWIETLKEITIGNSVTSIGKNAFQFCDGLTSITIPNSVTSIGNYAFYSSKFSNIYVNDIATICNGVWSALPRASAVNLYLNGELVTELVIPDSITAIGNNAFQNCAGLTSVAIPNSITSIGNSTFSGCAGLTSVAIPNSITSIGNSTFSNCAGLTEITIPNSVTSIGEQAFSYCTGLTEITIPNSVTSIGNYAFDNCTSIKEVKIEDGDEALSLGNNGNNLGLFYDCPLETLYLGRNIGYNAGKDYGYSPFGNIKTLKEITIGNSVTSIGNYAFFGCTGLTSITIPNSVTAIGNNAFSGCDGLTTVNFNAESCSTMGSTEGPVFANCTNFTKLNIGESVQTIPASAFSDCTGLTSITIPNSVTSIGEQAFANCTSLTRLDISENIESLGSDYLYGNQQDLTIVMHSLNPPMHVDPYYGFKKSEWKLIIPSEEVLPLYKEKGWIGEYEIIYMGEFEPFKFEAGGICYKAISNSEVRVISNANKYSGAVVIPSSIEYDGTTYSVIEIVESAFKDCTELTSVTIPNSITSIGDSTFSGCTGLTSITIPNSVTSIGGDAFKNCTGLTEVTIPNSVTSIGSRAFEGCAGLTSITIPNSVTEIGGGAFAGCTGLTSITIPNSVTSIGSRAFEGCAGLTSITIPNSVTSIGNYAFSGCTGLTSINLPNSVTSIGNYAFAYCTSLKKLDISENIQSLGDNYLYGNQQNLTIVMLSLNPPMHVDPYYGFKKSRWTLEIYEETLPLYKEKGWIGDYKLSYFNFESDAICYEAISNSKVRVISNVNKYSGSVVIPSSVEYDGTTYSVIEIDESAFAWCTGLTSITIPNSVTSIGNSVFDYCTSLKEVKMEDGAETLSLGYNYYNYSVAWGSTGEGLFYDCPLESLYLGRNLSYEESEDSGFSPFYNVKTLKEITIGNSVTSIGNYAFRDCTGLSEVTIPNCVTSIGNYAFDNCTSLKEVKIEDGAETLSLGYNYYRSTEIGQGLFYDCPLESFYLGRNISYYEEWSYALSPFYNIKTLKEIIIGNSVTSIGNYTFDGCKGLTSVTIPNSVTSIGKYAFSHCTGLTSVTIGNSVASIGGDAFYKCSISNIYIDDIATICNDVWSALPRASAVNLYLNNELLTELVIPDSITAIGNNAFQNCTGLTSVTIPNSVTSIGDSAFAYCTGLTSITIPNSVTSIGNYAFRNCKGLTSITIPNSVTSIGSWAFDNCTSIKEVKIEDGDATLSLGYNYYNSEEIGQGLFYDCPLESLYLGRNLSYRESEDSGFSPFCNNKTLKEITIGNSVASIGSYAFSGCTGLTSITIPNSVTSIGENAFKGCSNIRVINAHPTTPPVIGSDTFMDSVKQSAILNVPSLLAYTTADVWKDFADIREFAIEGYYDFEADGIYYRIVSLSDKTVEIVAKDDNYNSYSGDVVIPEIVFFKNNNFTVVSIGQAAFHNCNELLSLTIPQHVEEIKAGALSGCSALKTLTIADSDKTLKTNQNFKGLSIESLYLGRDYEGDFSACVSLQNVEISNKVTTLQEYTFDGCTSLTQLVLPESLKTIESYALSKTGIKELVIPTAVSEIKDNACSNSEISKLIIDAKDVILGNYVFYNCPLTHIYLKETIKDGFFDGFKNLKTVVIGGDLDNEDNHGDTFINCNIDELIIDCEKVYCLFSICNISKLHFSNNLSEWCKEGFDNRNDFIEISFGNDVTKIYDFITTGCSNLKTVKFGNKVESISANFGNSLEAMSVYSYNTTPPALEHAFANKTYMQGTLYVPKGCKDVYLAADGWKDFWNVEEISSITDNNLSYNLLDDNTLALIPDATGGIYSGQVVIPATVEVDGEVYKVSRIEANTFDNAYGVTSVIIEDSKEPLTIGEREEEITDNNYRVLLSDCMLDSVYVGRELAYQIKELETPEYVLYNNSPFTNNTYLSKVTVGPEVLTMGGAMFYGCRNIRNVYATGMIPPLEAEFETQVYEKATLTVPKGTLEAYTTTAGWEEFLNIVEEKVFSDIIENVNQPNTPVVVVSNGELTVMNGNAQDIAIYNMSGNLIYRGVNRPVRIDIHGVYIVVVDGFATKVVI